MRDTETFELDLKEIFEVLLKRVWIIAIVSVAGFAVTYVVSQYIIPPKYTSSVSLYVNNTSEMQSLNAVNINDINASQKLVNTYIVILQDDEVLSQLGQRLLQEYNPEWLAYHLALDETRAGPQVSTERLRSIITMSSVNSTEVLKIEAETMDAALSARICTLMTEVAPNTLMRVVKAGSVEVIGSAKPADEQSSPKVMLNSAIGFAAGLALAVVVVLLIHILDTTVKDEEGLKQRFNIPILGEIPDFSAPQKGGYARYGKR